MLKTLLYDLETSPLLSYVWEMYEANTLAVEKERELISFAYKWLGDKDVKVHSLRTCTEKELLQKLHQLFDQAEVLIAHNGDNFDNKMANAFFVKQGLKPPSPYKTIDTLKIARNKFRFASNHLNDLGKYLGLGEKVSTGGFGLWLKCLKGDKKAWKQMETYNQQDVNLLEKIYLKLAPWVKLPESYETGFKCPNCGSTNVQKRGWNITKFYMSQRYQCHCGKWSQSSNKIKHTFKPYLKSI